MVGRLTWIVVGLVALPWGAQAQSPQFRGEASHRGVFDTRGVERFGGIAWRFQSEGAVRSSPALDGSTL